MRIFSSGFQQINTLFPPAHYVSMIEV